MTFSSPATAGLLVALASTVAYAESNRLDKVDRLKPGVSTKNEAVTLLGKPMCENMVDGCALCTFSDGTQVTTLKFDRKGILEDRKDWSHNR